MRTNSLLSSKNPDMTVVIPCLNEEDTLGECLSKLETVAKKDHFKIEVIVADNGSQDKSIGIASQYNARVVHVSRKGYGAALMGGIAQAKAPFVLMADADDSYDFLEIPKFFQKTKEGFDLIQGCRLPGGGGKIIKGAMPWSHRHIGNPLFTFLVRSWFSSPIHDVYCGMRAFKKSFYDSLKMRCTGMEFATEMIIKAANLEAKTVEVPITLHKDGRIQHPPHLRTIRDGWKTLQFFLICAPSKLFLLPGLIMCSIGILGGALGYFGSSWGPVTLGAHTMLGSSLFIISGYQAILMHLLSLDISHKIGMSKSEKETITQKLIRSQGSRIWLLQLISGLFLWGKVFMSWLGSDFGQLDYATTMKLVIPGATLISLSLEMMIFTFFRSWVKVEIDN
jgi:glycosyltransferase involved in cell wall biosynthesis